MKFMDNFKLDTSLLVLALETLLEQVRDGYGDNEKIQRIEEQITSLKNDRL